MIDRAATNPEPRHEPLPDEWRPLGRRVPALLVNGSFLDVLDEVASRLEGLGFDLTTSREFMALDRAGRQRLLAKVEVVFGPGPVTPEAIATAPHLKVISLASSGYESVDIDAATARGIVVTNAPTDLGTESVADLTFGLILDVARQISHANRQLRSGVWQRPLGATVWRKTLGIIGLGRIGRAVAARAAGFGMTVLALSHHGDPASADLGLQFVPLPELLGRSDYISLHSRYTARTHHLIGRAELRQMKESAYLINTSRPGIIDQAALIEALTRGWIAGAGLDVFDGEPSTDDPILVLPNVVVTPHIGNRTREGVLDVVEQSIRNALAVLHGRRPELVVNPSVYERGVR
jgi:D-3-phosphoglycerate dehydrogenase